MQQECQRDKESKNSKVDAHKAPPKPSSGPNWLANHEDKSVSQEIKIFLGDAQLKYKEAVWIPNSRSEKKRR